MTVKTVPKTNQIYVSLGSNKKPVIYVNPKKMLYKCLKSALLFYKKLSADMIIQGFKINP